MYNHKYFNTHEKKYNLNNLNPFMINTDFFTKKTVTSQFKKQPSHFVLHAKQSPYKPYVQIQVAPTKEKVESLFWAFYYLVIGDYEKKKEFSIKNDYCIKFIEDIKHDKLLLKENKITLHKLEENLVYGKELNLDTLKILFLKNKKNAFYVLNNKYYIFEGMEENSFDCIVEKDGDIFIERNISEERKNEISKSHFYVASTKKVINSMSYYKLEEIKKIAETLGIEFMDASNQKKKTKEQLYMEIKQLLA